ncbi:MAG TPA: DUF2231 domain-containing protein [Acidimicrobiales bacterium]|nr:DUF2231 domain-containing protein [Acidimicrobiales bacterium]
MANPVTTAVHHVEQAEGLDRPAAALERALAPLGRPGRLRDLLTGVPLGHAAHPMLTDIPIGCWTSATVLDLTGGPAARPGARRLLGLGNLAALPAAVTGAAEWLQADTASRRVGVVHANSNLVGLALYGTSWLARRRGRQALGVSLALAGMAVTTFAGHLGGHLAIARKVGTAVGEPDRHSSVAKRSSP